MRGTEINSFNFSNNGDRVRLTNSNLSYDHFRLGDGFITIAGRLVNGKLYYGVSLCSPQDNFSKKEGRRLATLSIYDRKRRYLRGVMSDYGTLNTDHPSIVLKKAVEKHMNKFNVPKWAKNRPVEFRK